MEYKLDYIVLDSACCISGEREHIDETKELIALLLLQSCYRLGACVLHLFLAVLLVCMCLLHTLVIFTCGL